MGIGLKAMLKVVSLIEKKGPFSSKSLRDLTGKFAYRDDAGMIITVQTSASEGML